MMAAGGAGVSEDNFVIDWVDPHLFEDGLAEVRVGGAEVGQMDVGFRGGGDESQIKRVVGSLVRWIATRVLEANEEAESMS